MPKALVNEHKSCLSEIGHFNGGGRADQIARGLDPVDDRNIESIVSPRRKPDALIVPPSDTRSAGALV